MNYYTILPYEEYPKVMTRKKYPILYILILLLLACVQQSHGQSKDSNILNRHIKDLTIRDQNINLALSRIAGDYHIPIGLEMVPGEGGAVEKNIKLDIKDSTCREIDRKSTRLNSSHIP